MKSCSLEAPHSPVSWPGLARSGPPAHLQEDMSSDAMLSGRAHLPARHPALTPRDKQGEVVTTVGWGARVAMAQTVVFWKLIPPSQIVSVSRSTNTTLRSKVTRSPNLAE